MNHLGQRLVQKKPSYNSKAKDGFEYWYKEPKANITGNFMHYFKHAAYLSIVLVGVKLIVFNFSTVVLYNKN